MIAPFRLAFGAARLRALKSRLLGPAQGAALLGSADLASVAQLVDPESPLDARELERRAFSRLVADYAKVVASFPPGRSFLLALFRRHEVENLKLGWRARNGAATVGWTVRWKALGHLATLDRELWERTESLPEIVFRLRRTPYGEVTATALAAHAGDPAAAELAFDRWTGSRLLEEARRLPRRERAAKELALAWIRERDVDLLRRRGGIALTPEAAAASTALLREEERHEELLRLLEWRPEEGPLGRSLPRGLARLAARSRDWDELETSLARRRRALCRRTFFGNPFRLAPAVGYLFLREAEVRALGAVAESRGRTDVAATLERALAPSLLGA